MGPARNILPRSLFFFALYMLVCGGPYPALAGDAVRINGSGSGLEMMKPLIAGYGNSFRDVSFVMEKPLGSSGAVKALLAGAIDIAVTSKPLKPEEAAGGAKLRRFGKTPLAFVTGKNVPVKNISVTELEDIYSGKTTKWPNGESIRVILRPNEDIDTYILKGLSPGMAASIAIAQRRQGMIIAVTDPESNEMVSKTTGGIGASGLTGVLVGKIPLSVLTLHGVKPSRRTLADGTYPLAKDVNFVTAGRLPPAAARFLDFVYSPRGRAIAERAGVLITADGK